MSETKGPYRVSDLPGLTGFSMRYWQRRVAAGHVPGCREVACGKRRVFLIDSAAFESWWEREARPICPRTSVKEAVSGGIASKSGA